MRGLRGLDLGVVPGHPYTGAQLKSLQVVPQLDTGFGGELSEVYSLEVLGAELSELSVVQPYLLISLQVHAMQQAA